MITSIYDKAKNEEGYLINLFSITTTNTKVSLLTITVVYKGFKSFTFLNITALAKTSKKENKND